MPNFLNQTPVIARRKKAIAKLAPAKRLAFNRAPKTRVAKVRSQPIRFGGTGRSQAAVKKAQFNNKRAKQRSFAKSVMGAKRKG